MNRGYRREGGETSLESFRDFDRAPSHTAEHAGQCACGELTSRSVAGIGWQCKTCGEASLRQQFDRRTRKS